MTVALVSPKNVWKAKGENGKPRFIPMEELEDDHLQKAYFTAQNKELDAHNRVMEEVKIHEEKLEEENRVHELNLKDLDKRYETYKEVRMNLEAEANRRGFDLRSIEEKNERIGEYFSRTRLIYKAIERDKK